MPCSICKSDRPTPYSFRDLPVCDECQTAIQDYQDRVTRRHARLVAASERAFQEGTDLDKRADSLIGWEFGQPVLVGHHSERKHRRALDRVQTLSTRAYEARLRSLELSRRAAAVESNRAVSSDDPTGVIQLREKLYALEQRQARMVAINKCVQKIAAKPRQTKAQKEAKESARRAALHTSMQASNDLFRAEQAEKKAWLDTLPAKAPDLAKLAGISEAEALRLLTPDFVGRIGFADYEIKNNNANIRNVRERLADLEAVAERRTQDDIETLYTLDGIQITIRESGAANRIQIAFPAKPAGSVLGVLRDHGFIWAPSQNAHQRKLNNGARYAAECVMQRIGAVKQEPTPAAIPSDTDWCAWGVDDSPFYQFSGCARDSLDSEELFCDPAELARRAENGLNVLPLLRDSTPDEYERYEGQLTLAIDRNGYPIPPRHIRIQGWNQLVEAYRVMGKLSQGDQEQIHLWIQHLDKIGESEDSIGRLVIDQINTWLSRYPYKGTYPTD